MRRRRTGWRLLPLVFLILLVLLLAVVVHFFLLEPALAQIPVQPLIVTKSELETLDAVDQRALPVILINAASDTDCDPATAGGPFIHFCFYCDGAGVWQVEGSCTFEVLIYLLDGEGNRLADGEGNLLTEPTIIP